MAEAALFGIAKSVLQQLASPALDEFRLLWGHKEQFEKLEDTVITIRNVLQDADRRQSTDAAVQGWLAQLRVVLYEADDLFDAISAKVLLKKDKKGTKIAKKVRYFVSKQYRFAFLVKNAHKVKEIRERFDDIARDIKGFNFLPNQTDVDPTSSRIGREQTHSYVLRNEVIGREQEKEDLVCLLLPDSAEEQRGVSVIAVIGIGGLGKTTLAKLVYNDERVQQGFDLCMWACINYFSDLKQVLITLLKSATMSEPKNVDLDQLQSFFREEIVGKRFLLVLDDVWDENPQNWRALKELLSSGRDGSKIVTTTRSEVVAQCLCATKPYFHLQGMSDQSAWLLFKKIAFGEEEDRNSSELEQLGLRIVRKCANVPLAIITIASLLREKEKETWSPLVNGELSKVFPDEYKKITHILEISYRELPYPVKRCFGYCSLFPKDYEFEKGSLVRLWIAQGFVEPLANQSLEDRAENYFDYLVKRCFFQLTTRDKGKQGIVTYQMHDLMHDLSTVVAGSESVLVDRISHSSWDKTVRNVSIYYRSESMVDNVCSFSHLKNLRTFMRPCRISLGKNALEKLISGFRSLRVLDLSDLYMSEVPTSIGRLIHLRFLDLSGNYMDRLPSSICTLCHLQSLILRYCKYLKELPEDLGDLLSLRHLVLQGCRRMFKMPPGLAALTSLMTLDKLVVHNPSGGLKYLEGLDNLTGSLRIELPSTEWESATTDAEKSSLSRKSRLRALDIIHESKCLEHDTDDSANTMINALQPPPNLVDLSIHCFGGKKMPHWVSRLHKLVILKLDECERCVELPPLSHLPSLKELHISGMSSLWTIEDNRFYKPNSFFPSLETLSIENMLNLTSWWLQSPTVLPAFPRLTRVSICYCPELTRCMPLFPLVKHLLLEDVREEIIWRAIGREATSSTSHGDSVLKKLDIRGIEDLSNISEAQIRHLISLEYLSIPTVNKNLFKGLKYMASLETLMIHNSFNQELQDEEDGEEEEGLLWKNLQKMRTMTLVFGETFSMRTNQRLLQGLQDLTALKELTLCNCKELYFSWRGLLRLGNLQNVRIYYVEEVIDVDSDVATIQTQPISHSIKNLRIEGGSGEWVNDMPWKSFPFLKDLTLFRIRNLEALPKGIQHLVALQGLRIRDIKGVASLPYWMSSLSSLRYFESLESGEELKKRCDRLTGEDWPNIQHIQHTVIR